MKIHLKSKVNKDLETVYNRFDIKLFSYLLPPGAQLIQYGGSEKGDIVHLKLPLAGEWISVITENEKSTEMCFFVDEGRKLPFPLKRWKHKHILHRADSRTIIEDKINFTTGNGMFDLLLFPFLFLSFLPRVWQYQSYFNH